MLLMHYQPLAQTAVQLIIQKHFPFLFLVHYQEALARQHSVLYLTRVFKPFHTLRYLSKLDWGNEGLTHQFHSLSFEC